MAYIVFSTILTLTTQFSIYRIYCNEIVLLYKPIASEFIKTTWYNLFVVAIKPYCNDFVVVTMIFSVVTDLFSCSVMCLNHVKYRHVNL